MEEIQFQKPSYVTESKWGDPTFEFFSAKACQKNNFAMTVAFSN